jgi:hypothetical protein
LTTAGVSVVSVVSAVESAAAVAFFGFFALLALGMGGSLKIRKKAKRKAAVSEGVHGKIHSQVGTCFIIVRPVQFRYGLFGTC